MSTAASAPEVFASSGLNVKPSTLQGHVVRPGVEIFGLGDAPIRPSYAAYQKRPTAVANGRVKPLVVYFDYNSSRLDSADFAQVADFASIYRGGVVPNISVEGHASPEKNLGQNVGNMKVSLDRANAVAKALVESGVPADKITVQAFGAKRGAPSFLHKGENADRRVEVHVR